MAWRSRRRSIDIDGRAVPLVPGSGVAIYETAGRVLLRIVDGSDGPGIERWDDHALDGFPDIDPAVLGDAVVSLAGQARLVDLPTTWPMLSEYAAPLLDASPTRHRSYRSWQRHTRHASVALRTDGVHVARLAADLGRGAWLPDGPALHLVEPTTREIGGAVLELLGPPPVAGGTSGQ